MTKFYGTEKAAELLNVHTRHVVLLIKQGKIKAKKLDPRKITSPYLISEKEIKRYQANRKPRGRPKTLRP
jgi:excisionase family DNA binding protein